MLRCANISESVSARHVWATHKMETFGRGFGDVRRRAPNQSVHSGVMSETGLNLGKRIEWVNEVVRGIFADKILMYTICFTSLPLVAVSAEGARRKFFFAARDRWTSLVHLEIQSGPANC